MQNKQEFNRDVFGVAYAESGANIYQEIHLPDYKTPKQLTNKSGIKSIIGRELALEEIEKKLNTSHCLLVNGLGGIGKSTIASYYLYSKKDEVDYYGFFEGLDSFITELREPLQLEQEKDENIFMEALTKLRKLKGSKLLVIDNIEDVENQKNLIDRILSLKNNGFKILLTSREEIEDIENYELKVLNLNDAKKFFNSIYEVKDEKLLEEILGYLDFHALFVEMTAKTLKNKQTLTLQKLKEKFKSGEFSEITIKRKESFEKYLNQLFNFEKLDEDEILLLQQFVTLPSIEISFNFLEDIFDKKDNEDFEDILNYLSEKGWLICKNNTYKLHQIIKEYIFRFQLPEFEDIIILIGFFNNFMNYIVSNNEVNLSRRYFIYFDSLYTILEKINIENEKVFISIGNIGNICHILNMYQKADFFYNKALITSKKLFGDVHFYTSRSYNDLAGLYMSVGEYQEAENLFYKALSIKKQIFDEKNINIAVINNNLARLHESKGEYKKAKEFFMEALTIYEKDSKDYLVIVTINNNLAGLYESTSDYKEAEFFYNKALIISEKKLGKEHYNTAVCYNNLAYLYQKIGNYNKAKFFYNKALIISEKKLGEKNSDTAMLYNNLAELHQLDSNSEKAEFFHKKALHIREQVLGKEHLDTAMSYHNLATFHHSKKLFKKAKILYYKAMTIYQQKLGEMHPTTARSYNNLAELYQLTGKCKEAEDYLNKALNIREQVLGKEHADTATSYNNLALFYYTEGKYKDAYNYMNKAIYILKRILPKNHPNLASSQTSLIMIEKMLNKNIPIVISQKIGRNELCPCKSGKKYKQCCGKKL